MIPRALPWAFAFRPVGAGKALFIPWPPAGPSDSIADMGYGDLDEGGQGVKKWEVIRVK